MMWNGVPWGDKFEHKYLNFNDKDSNGAVDGFRETSPVNQYPQGASPWSCYDMCGNMWGMTSSRVGGYYNQRGGSWAHGWHELNYWGCEPYNQSKGYRGFRLAKDVPA